MFTKVKAIKKENKEDFYEVAAIVVGLDGGIPLVKDGNLWRLPSRWSRKMEYPEITLLYGVDSEIGIVVEYPEREVLRIPKPKYDFIVLKARYFKGELKTKTEIERVEQFNSSQIQQMIRCEEIMPDHAKALMEYIKQVYYQSF